MDIHIVHEWARQAADRVKFRPDRDKVFRELVHHMEDRAEDLRSRGMPEEEAFRAAVESMGDAREVGDQLNAVHKLWLGRLWMMSKVLVILLVIVTVILTLINWSVWDLRGHYRMQDSYEEALERATVLYDAEPKGLSAKLDGHTVQVERVSLVTYGTSGLDNRILLLLDVKGFLPWQLGPDLSTAWLVDSHGTVYHGYGDGYLLSTYTGADIFRVGRTPTAWRYCVQASVFPQDAEWVELRYDRAGRNFVLRIPLAGGEAA